MRITARRLRPDALLDSFLGLLDIKLGASPPSFLPREVLTISTGAEIILLFGVYSPRLYSRTTLTTSS